MKKTNKTNYRTLGYVVLAILVLTVLVIEVQGQNLQGYLKLGNTVSSQNAGYLHMAAVSGSPRPVTGEPVSKNTVTKGALARLIVAMKQVDTSSYKGCAPDLKNKYYETYACYLVAKDILSLSPDGKFYGDNTISRAEAAKVFYNAFFNGMLYKGKAQVYQDVKPTDWFYIYVMTLQQNGILEANAPIPATGANTLLKTLLFKPLDPLTKDSAVNWAQNINAKGYKKK